MPNIRITPIESIEQWLDLRRGYVGASEGAALVDEHPFVTRLGLWAAKLGKTPPIDDTGPMRRGRKLEPVAVEFIRDEFPTWEVTVPARHYADESIKLGATPDLFVTAPPPHGFGVVQIKSVEPGVFARAWRDEHGEVRPPMYVVIQTLIEAHLVAADWCAVAALVIGHGIDLHLVDIPLHAGLIARIRDECALFWHQVESGKQPEPDYGRDGGLIASLFRRDDGGEIDLAGDNELPMILERRERAAEARKFNDAEVKTCDAMLMHKLGTAAIGKFNGGYVSAKTIDRKGYSVPPSSYRQLRIVRKGQAA